jgi:serine/threonine-protein kinase
MSSPSAPPLPTGAPEAWLDAYRFKMRGQHMAVTALCVGGGAFLGVIADDRGLMLFAWACMAGIIGAAWLQRMLSRRRADETVYWPWAIVGALSVGPALSVGLHSGFASMVAWIVFLGGLFRATQRASGTERRWLVLVAICTAHGIAFALIHSGVVPDRGNVPVRSAGAPWWDPIVQHVLLQLVYVGAFVAGSMVDRRWESLMHEAEAAARKAAAQEAALAATSMETERVRAAAGEEALFEKQRVGRYLLSRLIARGGMGDVYEASDESSGRRVAVKILRREKADDPIALELFVKEAQALARVQSPWVATVLDAGGAEDEVPYIAMEYIEGRGLAAILAERGRLPHGEVRALVRDVARGLRDVHGAGILHRDLKPPNIMLTGTEDGPRWKIVDLGVAQIHDLVGAAHATVAGTPMYMAPEQALGERVDARADLYSLALVIYRALTGRPAYVGHDRHEIARAAHAQPPPNPVRFVADLPEDVVLVLRIGLAVKAGDRFATASQLAAAFESAFAGAASEDVRRRGRELLAREPWS